VFEYLSHILVSEDEVRSVVERVETMGTHNEGARIIAKAWCDSEFKVSECLSVFVALFFSVDRNAFWRMGTTPARS
jgi:hypothetical protein